MRPNSYDDEELLTRAEYALPRMKYDGPYKKAAEVAEYYGFRLVSPMRIRPDDRVNVSGCEAPAERVALLRYYLQHGMDGWAQPALLAHTYKVPYQPEVHFKLEALGSKKGISEALLIHTALSILKEHRKHNLSVRINSMGGLDSINRFSQELIKYYKQHINKLDPETREAFKKDCFAPLHTNTKEARDLRKNAPRPLNYLGDASRQHFYDVLEHLESLGIPYTIADHLVGRYQYNVRTMFTIGERPRTDLPDETDVPDVETYAYGERYDRLARKSGLGMRVPAVGVTMSLGNSKAQEKFSQYKKGSAAPKVFFIQLGVNAKRVALRLCEDMRRARIPVTTVIPEESLITQMRHAEELGAPIVLILGQKELADGTVIIRDRDTRSQKVIPQDKLVTNLRRICK